MNNRQHTTLCIRHYSLSQFLQSRTKHNRQNIAKQNLRQATAHTLTVGCNAWHNP